MKGASRAARGSGNAVRAAGPDFMRDVMRHAGGRPSSPPLGTPQPAASPAQRRREGAAASAPGAAAAGGSSAGQAPWVQATVRPPPQLASALGVGLK